MSKFLFIVLPGLGHLNPTLSISVELKKRGHQVAYASGQDVRKPVENEGFEFFNAGPQGMSKQNENMQKALKAKGLASTAFFFRALLVHCEESLKDLLVIVKDYKPDVIVVDTLTFAGAMVAEHYNIPWAACSAVPGMIPSKDVPPYSHMGLRPSGNMFVKAFHNLLRFNQNSFFRSYDRLFKKLRKALELSPLKNAIVNTTLSPNLILVYSLEGFEYKRNDWPPQLHLIGPSPWGRVIDDTSYDWIDELPEDKPVIYITLGTFQAYRSVNFFDMVIEALKDEPYYVVLCVSHGVNLDDFQEVPANFRIEQFVPNARILPKVSAVVHHGGFGIAQDTIYNGLPAVVIPVAQDCHENARRCTEAGTAVKIDLAKLTPEKLREAVGFILEDEGITENTTNLQKKFLSTNAGKTGADLLEKFSETKEPVYRDKKM